MTSGTEANGIDLNLNSPIVISAYEIRRMELTLVRFLFESLQNVRWHWQYVLKEEK